MARRTTVGQLLIQRELPEDLRDKAQVLDKDGLGALMETLSRRDPDEYRRVTYGLQRVGAELAYRAGGASFGLRHLTQSEGMKRRRAELTQKIQDVLRDPEIPRSKKDDHIVRLLQGFQGPEQKEILREAKEAGNPLALQVVSGARGSAGNLAALLGGDVMYMDARGRPIAVPILRGFSQGLRPAEYWAATYGARRAMIDTKLGVQNAGDLGKQLSRASHRAVVIGLDDDRPDAELTARGLPVETDDGDNEGSLLAIPAGRFPRNTILTRQHLDELKEAGIKRILVRSPAVSQSEDGGVWARDVGVREFGRLPRTHEQVGITAAQALAEPLTQMSLGSKHSGGVAKAKQERSGFKYLDQLLQIPKIFPGGAAHAETDGTITAVDKAPIGGWNISIGNERHYVPAEQTVSVKPGDKVEAGDVLSDGIPNPAVVARLKGLGEGRRYLVGAFRDAIRNSGLKAHRRNVEIVVGKLLNHVELDEEIGDFIPGDIVPYSALEARWKPRAGHVVQDARQAVGRYLERPYLHHTIGTRVTPRVAEELREFGVDKIAVHQEPPPFRPEAIRAEANIQYDPDWMTKFLGVGLKSTTLKGVHRGGTSDPSSTSYVPGLAVAKDFGHYGQVRTPDSSPAKPFEIPSPPAPVGQNSAHAELLKRSDQLMDSLVGAQSPFQSLPEPDPNAQQQPYGLQAGMALYPQLPELISSLGPLGLAAYGAILSPGDMAKMVAGILPESIRARVEGREPGQPLPGGRPDGPAMAGPGPAAGRETRRGNPRVLPARQSASTNPTDPATGRPVAKPEILTGPARPDGWYLDELKDDSERELARSVASRLLQNHYQYSQLQRHAKQPEQSGFLPPDVVGPLKKSLLTKDDNLLRQILNRRDVAEMFDAVNRPGHAPVDWGRFNPGFDEADTRRIAAMEAPPEGVDPEKWNELKQRVEGYDKFRQWAENWNPEAPAPAPGFGDLKVRENKPQAVAPPGLAEYVRFNHPELDYQKALADPAFMDAMHREMTGARRNTNAGGSIPGIVVPGDDSRMVLAPFDALRIADRNIRRLKEERQKQMNPEVEHSDMSRGHEPIRPFAKRRESSVWHGLDTPTGTSAAPNIIARYRSLAGLAPGFGESSHLQIMDRAADDYEKGVRATGANPRHPLDFRALPGQIGQLLQSPMIQAMPFMGGSYGKNLGKQEAYRRFEERRELNNRLSDMASELALKVPDRDVQSVAIRLLDDPETKKQIAAGAVVPSVETLSQDIRRSIAKRIVDRELGIGGSETSTAWESELARIADSTGQGLIDQARAKVGTRPRSATVGEAAMALPFGAMQAVSGLPGVLESQEFLASPVLGAVGAGADILRGRPPGSSALRTTGGFMDALKAPLRLWDRHMGSRLTQDDPSYRQRLMAGGTAAMDANKNPDTMVNMARRIVETDRSYRQLTDRLNAMDTTERAKMLDEMAGSPEGLDFLRGMAQHERERRQGQHLQQRAALLGDKHQEALSAFRENLPRVLQEQGFQLDPNMTPEDWDELGISMAVGKVPDSLTAALPQNEKGEIQLDPQRLFGGHLAGAAGSGRAGRWAGWAGGGLTHAGVALADLPAGMLAVRGTGFNPASGAQPTTRMGLKAQQLMQHPALSWNKAPGAVRWLSPANQAARGASGILTPAESGFSLRDPATALQVGQPALAHHLQNLPNQTGRLAKSTGAFFSPSVVPTTEAAKARLAQQAAANQQRWQAIRGRLGAPQAGAPAVKPAPSLPASTAIPTAVAPKPMQPTTNSPASLARQKLPGGAIGSGS